MNQSVPVAHNRTVVRRVMAAVTLVGLLVACGSDDADEAGGADGRTETATPLPASGVTDDTIRMGLFTVNTAALNDASEGATGSDAEVASGSIDAAQDAVIAYINDNGGIAGRRVEPVYVELNAQNLATPEGRAREAQAACATWTEDDEMFAFVAFNDILFDCAATSGSIAVSGVVAAPTVSDEHLTDFGPLWYSTTNFTAERRERAMAAFLLDQEFFDADARIAFVVEDNPARRAGVDKALAPALADEGIEPVLEIAYADAIAAPWPNYVLQLQEARVTHVVFSGTSESCFPAMSLMRAAEDQQYPPAWALGSDLAPDGLITVGQTPPEQLADLLAMGWAPTLDIGDAAGQGANGELCDSILVDAGQDHSAGRSTCDLLLFLQAALDGAEAIGPGAVADGVAELADTFASPSTIDGTTSFAEGRHDGVAVVRAVSFDPSSPTHLEYASPAVPLDDLLGSE